MLATLISSINLRPKNPKFLTIGLVLFFLFVVLLFLEAFGFLIKFDPFVTSTLQTIIPRFLDTPLSFFSILGSLELTTFFLFGLTGVIFRQKKIILFSLGLFGVVMVFEVIGKFFLFHPGPPKIFLRYDLPFSTPEYLSTSYSFPSGHVGRTTFLIVVASALTAKLVKSRGIRIALLVLLITFLLVMAISRIYLGEHWTSDVFGGLLLGGAMGFFAMVYYD